MKRKCLAVGIILLFIGTAVIPLTAQNIGKSSLASRGHWLYVGGSGPGNYSRIQDAIDNSSNGDTVFVYNGTYNENDSIRKSINLIGEKREITFINGCIDVVADWVNVSGFSIQNSASDREFGISLQKSPYNSISKYCNISNNIIDSNGYYGIYLSAYNIIKNNVISNDDYGIWLNDHNIVKENKIINNYIGIHSPGEYNLIYHNNISFSGMIGIDISVDDSNDFSIDNNNISGNNIYSTNTAIHLSGGKSIISDNNFIKNGHIIQFAVRPFHRNIWNGNYWDDYHGVGPYLIRGNLIIIDFDMPYLNYHFEIPWVNFDWHPAHKPNDIPGMSK